MEVNLEPPLTFEEIEKELRNVRVGGLWRPHNCTSKKRTAIIIPFKDRQEQLKIFVRHYHPILQRQNIHYRIFVIEQNDTSPFNRAKLLNIGFLEATKYDKQFQCYIFHDVDLLLENDKNMYNCDESPQHLCPSVDKFNYELFSDRLFGGATAFKKSDFLKINGYSNKYWGWGCEDDDMYWRLYHTRIKIKRPSIHIGRYKMIKHANEKRNGKAILLLKRTERGDNKNKNDGLTTINYVVNEYRNEALFTNIKVNSRMTAEEISLTSLKRHIESF